MRNTHAVLGAAVLLGGVLLFSLRPSPAAAQAAGPGSVKLVSQYLLTFTAGQVEVSQRINHVDIRKTVVILSGAVLADDFGAAKAQNGAVLMELTANRFKVRVDKDGGVNRWVSAQVIEYK